MGVVPVDIFFQHCILSLHKCLLKSLWLLSIVTWRLMPVFLESPRVGASNLSHRKGILSVVICFVQYVCLFKLNNTKPPRFNTPLLTKKSFCTTDPDTFTFHPIMIVILSHLSLCPQVVVVEVNKAISRNYAVFQRALIISTYANKTQLLQHLFFFWSRLSLFNCTFSVLKYKSIVCVMWCREKCLSLISSYAARILIVSLARTFLIASKTLLHTSCHKHWAKKIMILNSFLSCYIYRHATASAGVLFRILGMTY